MRAALALAVAAAAAGCSHHAAYEVEGTRRAAKHAVAIVRPTAPKQARLIEQLVALAEIATAAETNAPWWEGSLGRTQAAWLRVARASHEATASVRSVLDQARMSYRTTYPDVRNEVVRAQAEIREAGMARREAAAMENAIMGLKLAEKLAAGGRHGQALDELRQARNNAAIIHHTWASLHARLADPANLRTWKKWVELTLDESRQTGDSVILVDKLRRRVTIYRSGQPVGRFPAELGANGLRRKEHAGDRATPEGMYRVVQIKEAPQTKFYKALLLNYPNDEDRMRFALGQRRGEISARAGIGSLIEIHGAGGEGRDWTDGCIALTNEDMDRLFRQVRLGTAVTIVGSYEH